MEQKTSNPRRDGNFGALALGSIPFSEWAALGDAFGGRCGRLEGLPQTSRNGRRAH